MDSAMKELAGQLGICQAMCNFCLESCLKENDVHMMVECIRLDKECGEICSVAIAFISSDSATTSCILEMCADACEKCAAECRKHAYDHCRECAETCERCAAACRGYVS